MQFSPIQNEVESATREVSIEHLQGLDVDRNFPVPIPCMKVGRRMFALAPVHDDHDSEEARDFGHGRELTLSSRRRPATAWGMV